MKNLLLGAIFCLSTQAVMASSNCPEISGIFKCKLQESDDAKQYNVKLESLNSLSEKRVLIWSGKKTFISLEGEDLKCANNSITINRQTLYNTDFVFTPEGQSIVKLESISKYKGIKNAPLIKKQSICYKISEI